jgi:hypothetical protein
VNILEIWKANGQAVPFAVRRDGWAGKYYVIVESVTIRRWPYGEATGYPVVNGEPNDHFVYDQAWRERRVIPNAGSNQWSLVPTRPDNGKLIALDTDKVDELVGLGLW